MKHPYLSHNEKLLISYYRDNMDKTKPYFIAMYEVIKALHDLFRPIFHKIEKLFNFGR